MRMMMMTLPFLVFGLAAPAAYADQTPSPKGAEAYFISPNDGDVLPSGKFQIQFGLRNMGVAPAGVKRQKTGHFHLIINKDLPPLTEHIPADKDHIHYGGGQIQTIVDLPPGKHTLQLLLGDHNHAPHNPPVYSKKITVTVK